MEKIEEVQELEGSTRVQELSDGTRVYYVEIGNLSNADVDEYMRKLIARVQTPGRTTDIWIPFRHKPAVIQNTDSRALWWNAIATWLVIIVILLSL